MCTVVRTILEVRLPNCSVCRTKLLMKWRIDTVLNSYSIFLCFVMHTVVRTQRSSRYSFPEEPHTQTTNIRIGLITVSR